MKCCLKISQLINFINWINFIYITQLSISSFRGKHWLVLVIRKFIILFLVDDGGLCESGWIYYNDTESCYFFPLTTWTYSAIEKKCQEKGAHAPSVKDKEEIATKTVEFRDIQSKKEDEIKNLTKRASQAEDDFSNTMEDLKKVKG